MRLPDPGPLPIVPKECFSSESVYGINAAMEFKPLHFADRLTIINPQGTVGVVTLWSKPDYVIERFRQAGVDLNPATSPIAVFGTLYGNGLREMLRNLLYNPQIQTLLICGHDRSGSWSGTDGIILNWAWSQRLTAEGLIDVIGALPQPGAR